MSAKRKSQEQLRGELAELRARLEETEEALQAIRGGQVDAVVVSGPEGERVYTLKGADRSYRQLIEGMNEGAATVGANGEILFSNRRLAEMLGAPLEQVIGSAMDGFLEPADQPQWRALLRQAARGSARCELTLRARDGSGVAAQLAVSALQVDDLPVFCMVATDLTRQKQAEEQLRQLNEALKQRAAQLRALAWEVTQVEQRERRRLARILHDQLQQLLVGARMQIELVRKSLGDERLDRLLRQADTMLGRSLQTSRSLGVDLSPPVLYDAGLAAALQWLASEMQDKYGLSVSVQADGQVTVDLDTVGLLLFQAVRELLFNVVKHAHVKAARVRLRPLDGGQVEVLVADEGAGFDPTRLSAGGAAAGGSGLFNIRHRLDVLGGQMNVDSSPGQGTRMRLIAPQQAPTSSDQAGPSPDS
jgi:PAS domain S-box-containing protein